MKTVLNVTGMKCGGCETTIQDVVQACAGVVSVKANHLEGTVEIQYDEDKANLDAIRRTIADKGFSCAD